MIRHVTLAAVAFCLMIAGARLVKADPPAAPQITIDATKVREPMSKYIYGQFIEHLRRCIYGGIWAEMLEDRKFFYPVGEGKSPWKVVGPAIQVTNDPAKPFVGVRAPRIALAGDGKAVGIAHGELALRKGKRYVGHIWLTGEEEVGPVSVSLVWGNAPEARQTVTVGQLTAKYTKTPLAFTAAADTDRGRLEITAAGFGSYYVGTLSLMPADNVEGMRADTLACLKDLDSPVYRWPGGNFVSGYDWKDGIGDRDRRPPRENLAWKGVESNDFGLDEFMAFCRLLGTEPYVTVNSGLGDKQEAVEELQYANAPADQPGGRLRAKNGHPAPYGVKWWSIGNEMYGDWQLGHMTLEHYVQKHNAFAKAMRAADPAIKLIAVGDVGRWSKGMLKQCADQNGPDQRAFLSPGKAEIVVRPRGPNSRRNPRDCQGPPRLPRATRFAQGEGHPHRVGRVELLVRAFHVWRIRHAVSSERRPGHRRGAERVRSAKRHVLHGQLCSIGERAGLHQDHANGGRAGHDWPGAGALSEAFRHAARGR